MDKQIDIQYIVLEWWMPWGQIAEGQTDTGESSMVFNTSGKLIEKGLFDEVRFKWWPEWNERESQANARGRGTLQAEKRTSERLSVLGEL